MAKTGNARGRSLVKLGWFVVGGIAMVALTVAMIRVPQFLHGHGRKDRGVIAGETNFRKHACTLTFASPGEPLVEASGASVELKVGIPYTVNARCRQGGYLHLAIVDAAPGAGVAPGGDKASYFLNLPVGPWSESETLGGEVEPLTIKGPEGEVTLYLRYAFSLSPADAAVGDSLVNASGRSPFKGLVWVRETRVARRAM